MNLVRLLHDEIKISVLTGDRDLGAAETYPGVVPGAWNDWNGIAEVWYATKGQHYTGAYLRAVAELRPDAVYLNSMFSPSGCILPMLNQLVRPSTRVVIAPRGMLKPSALSTRRWKKTVWLSFLKSTGLAGRVVFHATSEIETDEIRTSFGKNTEVVVIPNAPAVPASEIEPSQKDPGRLRLSFVGRVHPIKNLMFVLRLLRQITFECTLDVIGPIEDSTYHGICKREAEALPSNISVNFLGAVAPDNVASVVSRSHAMILPTLGENFGHAIYEALAIGIPVLVSDQTPWRALDLDHAGWDINLNDPERFAFVLNWLGTMDADEHREWRSGAHQRAVSFQDQYNLKTAYHQMFFSEIPV
ncbi:MAG: glycosyltransferase [Planctomycetaceae bacterium]